MDEVVLQTNFLRNIVKNILRSFEKWQSKNSFVKTKYTHVDVSLTKNNCMRYIIQVTNYGLSINDITSFSNEAFADFTAVNFISQNLLVATVYSREDHHDRHDVLDLCLTKKRLSLIENTNAKSYLYFQRYKRYLSFQLKHTLIACDLEEFTETILDEIIVLQQLNPCIKFTIHHNQKMIYNNHIPLDSDYKSCHVVVNALTNVIKQSSNLQFKEECFSMLNVDNSHQVESALMVKLLPLINENYTFINDN